MPRKILAAFAAAASLVLFGPPAHAATLTGCTVSACSDAFFFTVGGQPMVMSSSDLATGLDSTSLAMDVDTSALDTSRAYIFTEEGTGIGLNAPVSDYVYLLPNSPIHVGALVAASDPFEGFTVMAAEAFLPTIQSGITKFTVVEETGSPQSLTDFGPDLTIQFGSDVETTTPVPAALPLFATGLGALGLLGWRRKRKGADGLMFST